jgi:methyl-accepting chemotaxis protein
MADVITRFRLETTQYDSKLRDAAKGLKEFTHQAQLGGKNFTDFSKEAVEAARSLGNVASGATNTKDKVRDLVGAFNEAARAYNNMS